MSPDRRAPRARRAILRVPGRKSSRGSAMPLVLSGMTLAILVATLTWQRAWRHGHDATRDLVVWQAQLLAESGLAAAIHEALDPPRRPVSAIDTTTAERGDSAARPAIAGPVRGTFEWSISDAHLLLTVIGTGRVRDGRADIVRRIRGRYAGSPDPKLFSAAITLLAPVAEPLQAARVAGALRAPGGAAGGGMTGWDSLPAGIDFPTYIPKALGSDTARNAQVLDTAFRSQGGDFGRRFGPGQPLPADRDELIFHTVPVVIEGPWFGDRWSPGRGRRVVVENGLEIRGRVDLSGWTFLVKGNVVVEGDARLEDVVIFSQGRVLIDGRSSVQGQIVGRGVVRISGEARIASPSVVVGLRGGGEDTTSRVFLDQASRVEAYCLALGPSGSIEIEPRARLAGVAAASDFIRNRGRIDGAAVARRIDQSNGTRGTFDRPALPIDFPFPLGIGGRMGLRLHSLETLDDDAADSKRGGT